MEELLRWDMYQISCADQSLIGVKLRGTLRKYGIDHGINLLTENASDADNCVRFAVLASNDATNIISFITTKVVNAEVTAVLQSIPNPVLSKLKVNDDSRYV